MLLVAGSKIDPLWGGMGTDHSDGSAYVLKIMHCKGTF